MMKYRENRTYNMLVNERNDYFTSMWLHMQKQLTLHSPYFEPDLLAMFSDRESNIISDILEEKLEIEFPKKFEEPDD